MSNPFDQFDVAAVPPADAPASPSANLFDKFDPPTQAAPTEQPAATLGETIADVGRSGLQGINQMIAGTAALPYRAIDWAGEKLTGGDFLPDAKTLPGWKQWLADPEPETTAGRYAAAAGQAVGAAAIPGMGIIAAAPRMAAMQATNGVRGALQSMGQQIAARPGVAAALDTASAATGGLAMEGAKDGGLGPTGQMVAGMAGSMVPGAAMALINPTRGLVGTQTGATRAQQRAADALEDVAAFDRQGVRQFGPSLNEGPVRGVAKQLTDTMFIGSPLRQNMEETTADAARAVARVADNMAPMATPEVAGSHLQMGLQRFASDRMNDLDPTTLGSVGIPSRAAVPNPTNMSQGQQQRMAQAQPIQQGLGLQTNTTRGTSRPAAQGLAQTLTARRRIDDLSDAELNRLIRTPAEDTSFATRSEALYERAYRMLPTIYRRDGSVDPLLGPTNNTAQALGEIQGSISNAISGQTTLNDPLVRRLMDVRSNMTLGDIRSIRTEVGRALGNLNPMNQTLDRRQLMSLYSALSRDMENALIDQANRAATRIGQPTATGGVQATLQDAQNAFGALRAFRTADRHFRLGQARIERFLDIVGAKTPETAAKRVIAAAMDGTKGSARTFRAAIGSLRPEERSGFASLLLRDLGATDPGARGLHQDLGWSPTKFVTNWQKLSPQARQMLFGGEHEQAINDLLRVANRLSNVDAMANTSRSATNAINFGMLTGSYTALTGDFWSSLMVGGSGYATAVLMSRPAYARWMTRYLQMRASIRSGASRSISPIIRHINGLERYAQTNPALAPVLYSLSQEVEDLQQRQQ